MSKMNILYSFVKMSCKGRPVKFLKNIFDLGIDQKFRIILRPGTITVIYDESDVIDDINLERWVGEDGEWDWDLADPFLVPNFLKLMSVLGWSSKMTVKTAKHKFVFRHEENRIHVDVCKNDDTMNGYHLHVDFIIDHLFKLNDKLKDTLERYIIFSPKKPKRDVTDAHVCAPKKIIEGEGWFVYEPDNRFAGPHAIISGYPFPIGKMVDSAENIMIYMNNVSYASEIEESGDFLDTPIVTRIEDTYHDVYEYVIEKLSDKIKEATTFAGYWDKLRTIRKEFGNVLDMVAEIGMSPIISFSSEDMVGISIAQVKLVEVPFMFVDREVDSFVRTNAIHDIVGHDPIFFIENDPQDNKETAKKVSNLHLRQNRNVIWFRCHDEKDVCFLTEMINSYKIPESDVVYADSVNEIGDVVKNESGNTTRYFYNFDTGEYVVDRHVRKVLVEMRRDGYIVNGNRCGEDEVRSLLRIVRTRYPYMEILGATPCQFDNRCLGTKGCDRMEDVVRSIIEEYVMCSRYQMGDKYLNNAFLHFFIPSLGILQKLGFDIDRIMKYL